MAPLLDTLLESIADAVYLVGSGGEVRYVNPAGLALLGYSEDELLGRDSHATIHFKHPDGTPYPPRECPLLAPLTTGAAVRVERDWFVRSDGAMVPVAYVSAPVQTLGGRGAVVVFRDISERLETEAALARAAAAQARAEEIAESRARIVAAAADERRRLVRDLHDGAQQRLVSLLLRLERGETQEAAADARRAIAELRSLAAGIHPAVLTDRGLAAALEDLTADASLPVLLDIEERRYPPDVEAAAYFVVAEALANVAKHAGATEVRVVARTGDGALRVSVADNGRGGADPSRGSGLRGLADRVAALGGTCEIDTSGPGTTLRASFPL
jgi:PAS domain S-box-containing protein